MQIVNLDVQVFVLHMKSVNLDAMVIAHIKKRIKDECKTL